MKDDQNDCKLKNRKKKKEVLKMLMDLRFLKKKTNKKKNNKIMFVYFLC